MKCMYVHLLTLKKLNCPVGTALKTTNSKEKLKRTNAFLLAPPATKLRFRWCQQLEAVCG